MGSPKQAHAIVILTDNVRRLSGLPKLTDSQKRSLAADVLAMSLAETQATFKKINAKLGFDRATSNATANQLKILQGLERYLYGQPRIHPELTFEACHALIDQLVAEKTERLAMIQQLEQFANAGSVLEGAGL